MARRSQGEKDVRQFDLDLRTRGGESLPVRLLHRAARSGDVAPSHVLVLKRAPGDEPVEDQDADASIARIFDATPMAIAIVDAGGRIMRWNPAFARLMPEALKLAGDGADRSIYCGVLERDREAVELYWRPPLARRPTLLQ